MRLIEAVPGLPSSPVDAENADTAQPQRIMIGRLRPAEVESTDDMRSQLLHLSQVPKAIGQMSLMGYE